jgi:glutaredoxin
VSRREQPKPRPTPQQVAGGAAAAPEEAQPEQTAAAPTALTAEEIERKRLQDLETAERDRRRSEQIKADFEERARKRARANVSITMYSTNWCPSCTAAREYMTREGILFTEHDIEQSDSARTIMHRLNPRKSIPTIDIEGTILVGFSSVKIEDAIEAAVKKRTGG